jgi:hypothetical protein
VTRPDRVEVDLNTIGKLAWVLLKIGERSEPAATCDDASSGLHRIGILPPSASIALNLTQPIFTRNQVEQTMAVH